MIHSRVGHLNSVAYFVSIFQGVTNTPVSIGHIPLEELHSFSQDQNPSSLPCFCLTLIFLFLSRNYRQKTLLVLDPDHAKAFQMLNSVYLLQNASVRLLHSRFFSQLTQFREILFKCPWKKLQFNVQIETFLENIFKMC